MREIHWQHVPVMLLKLSYLIPLLIVVAIGGAFAAAGLAFYDHLVWVWTYFRKRVSDAVNGR